MKYEEINGLVRAKRKGAYCTMQTAKQLKTKKGVTDIITKITYQQVRVGIKYDNLYAVKTKRLLNNNLQSNHSLPWGSYMDKDGYFIQHNDQTYLRYYNGANKTKVYYFRNGTQVEKDSVVKDCLASEFRVSSVKPDCYTVNINNIVAFK